MNAQPSSIIDNASAVLQRVRDFVAAGRGQDAEALLLSSCRDAPQDGIYPMHLGRLYLSQRRFSEAIAPLIGAVVLMPDDSAPRRLFTMAMHGREFGAFDETARQAMILCLQDSDLPHQNLAAAWLSFLRRDPALQSFFADDLYLNDPALENDFLLWGIKRLIINDARIETSLTRLRRMFLLNGAADSLFLFALSRYCFYTEHAFLLNDREREALETLRTTAATPHQITLLGCYEPLARHPHAKSFTALADQSQNKDFKDLIHLQIVEPLEERAIARQIPTLGAIADDVSRAVQAQYEENPYPRWASIGVPTLPEAVKEQARGKKILVAGCGTGKEAAEIASLFPLAAVTAIDLSGASLSYAARQCQRRGIDNIRFLHADILGIGAIDETFDLIVSSGVLHHMDDPVAGWRSLLGVLKPDGVIKIALYSTKARRFIRQARALIAAQGWQATPEGMRNFRAHVLSLPESDVFRQRMVAAPDFYTLSTLRDLVFHVQEHTFSLPQIAAIAKDLGLTPVRVDVTRPQDMATYRQDFPNDPSCADLDNWHRLEERDPDLFAGMYSIWFARTAAPFPADMGWIRATAGMG